MVDQEAEQLDRALRELGEVPPVFFGEPLAGLLRVAQDLTDALHSRGLSDAERAQLYLRALAQADQHAHGSGQLDRRVLVAAGGALGVLVLSAAVGAAVVRQRGRRSHPVVHRARKLAAA